MHICTFKKLKGCNHLASSQQIFDLFAFSTGNIRLLIICFSFVFTAFNPGSKPWKSKSQNAGYRRASLAGTQQIGCHKTTFTVKMTLSQRFRNSCTWVVRKKLLERCWRGFQNKLNILSLYKKTFLIWPILTLFTARGVGYQHPCHIFRPFSNKDGANGLKTWRQFNFKCFWKIWISIWLVIIL